MGILLTATGLGGFLALGPVGYLSDRGGQRKMLVVAMMGSAGLLMLAYPLFHSVAALVVVTLLVNAGYRASDTLVQAIAGDTAVGGRMGTWFGKVRVTGSMSWVISLLLSAHVGAMTDWRLAHGSVWVAPMFVLIGTLYVLAAAMIVLAAARPSRRRLRLLPFAALKAVARTPRLKRFLLAFALYWTGLQGISSFLSLFLKELGATHAQISWAFALSAISEIPFIYAAGRIAEVWGERRVLTVAFTTLPLRLLVYIVAPIPAVALAAQMLHGLTYGLMFIGAVTYVNNRLSPWLRASGQGALGVVMAASSTAGPLVGSLAGRWTGYRGSFAVLAAFAALGWIVLRGLPDDKRQDPKPNEQLADAV